MHNARKTYRIYISRSDDCSRIPTKKTATISFVKSKRIFNDFIIYFLQAFEIASKVWLSAWASSREESKVGVSIVYAKKNLTCIFKILIMESVKNYYTRGIAPIAF